MQKKVSLTGIKPTSLPHLGNYIGAIRPGIELAQSGNYDAFYFIADAHALNSVRDGKELRRYSHEVAAVWMSLGLSNVTLYLQSDIPEVFELNWILAAFTSKGLMNRAHSYKALVQNNEENSRDRDEGIHMGVFTYPILMSADILILSPDVVPVGPDQVQHLEMCRDIAQTFNHQYGQELKLPEAIVPKDSAVLPGLDGRKMSKSYGNHIPLFQTPKELKKSINRIKTDSSSPTEPKNPDDSLIMDIYKAFATAEQVQDLAARYRKGIGWGEAKEDLFQILESKLAGPREIYLDLMSNTQKIDQVLDAGRDVVRPKAQQLLKRVRDSIGFGR